jgi:hypothetical protein
MSRGFFALWMGDSPGAFSACLFNNANINQSRHKQTGFVNNGQSLGSTNSPDLTGMTGAGKQRPELH